MRLRALAAPDCMSLDETGSANAVNDSQHSLAHDESLRIYNERNVAKRSYFLRTESGFWPMRTAER